MTQSGRSHDPNSGHNPLFVDTYIGQASS